MTFTPAHFDAVPPMYLSAFHWMSVGDKYYAGNTTQPASGTWASANRCFYVPFFTPAPYDLRRFWWANGATVGTDSLQMGIYGVDGSNVLDLLVSSPRTLSAGTANRLQYATCSVVGHLITSGTSTTDGASFVTASVTLKARPGVMYLFSVENDHGSSANTVTVATTGGDVTFTSRNTTQFNGTTQRVSVFTAVPTTDVTDTITITIGSAQTATGCLWSLLAFSNVDTGTDHGIVQTAVNTGSSTTPSATLGAFGSANNATFGVAANGGGVASGPGTGFIEMSDSTHITPSAGMSTQYSSANDTSVDWTITSNPWGVVAAEIKSQGTTFALPAGRYYFGLYGTNNTMTIFRVSTSANAARVGIYNENLSTATGLPLTPTLSNTNNTVIPLMGITSRASP